MISSTRSFWRGAVAHSLSRALTCSLACSLTCSLAIPVVADEFVLKDGRSIRGAVTSERTVEAIKDKQYAVEVSPGVIILIKGREIKQHTRGSAPEREYAELMKDAQDTIEFHLTVASWCYQNGLSHHEVAHYERVLDLDSENATARAGLKYTKGKDGRWVKREVLMTEGRGKVRVGSKFRFPEIVALEEAQEAANKDRVEMLRDIRRWQQDVLDNNKRSAESLSKLQTLKGPQASSALAELLFPKSNVPLAKEPPPEAVRQLYVAVLARLADPVAVQTLIRLSLSDSSRAINDAALEAVRGIAPHLATLAFTQALRSDNPEQINAAARALAAMEDEAAILPLIEHVVTRHRRTTSGDNRTNVTFGSGGTGTNTFGKAAPKVVELASSNADVLAALTAITGESYGYDKNAWLNWYHQTYFTSAGDLRRDP